jgi:F0F1-type ATP synthase delta subunit
MAHELDHVRLPLSVITTIDLARVCRELDDLDEFLLQATLRKPGTPMQLPRLSKMLDDTATINKVNLLEEKQRKILISALTIAKDKAPRLHISFSAEPSPLFITKISEFIRKNIDQIALMQIGLQPTIAAGCVLRSSNRQFDFSLRQHLRESRPILVDLIGKIQDASQPVSIEVDVK